MPSNMNEDLDNIKYRQIKEIKYNKLFPDYKPTNVVLSSSERRQVVETINQRISQLVDGLKMMSDNLAEMRSETTDDNNIIESIHSFFFFTTLTTADCLVAFKYFLIADTDYDQKYMYGKLKVILNEGFKKLYGYNDKNHKVSEWTKISKLLPAFPDVIKKQYDVLDFLFDKQSKKSTWWQEERSNETHLDALKLYDSRNEIINESQVMLDTTQLLNALDAADQFVENLNICVINTFLDKYKKGELIE